MYLHVLDVEYTRDNCIYFTNTLDISHLYLFMSLRNNRSMKQKLKQKVSLPLQSKDSATFSQYLELIKSKRVNATNNFGS